MHSLEELLISYEKSSQEYHNSLGEGIEFFSLNDGKDNKDDSYFQEYVDNAKEEVKDVLSNIEINKKRKNHFALELVKCFLSHPDKNIKSYLDILQLEDISSIVEEEFEYEEMGRQFLHILKGERSQFDIEFIEKNILNNAYDKNGNPIELFQLNYKGNKIFAPYMVLDDQKYTFNTHHANLNYISSEIFIHIGSMKISLQDFLKKYGSTFTIKINNAVVPNPDTIKIPSFWVSHQKGNPFTGVMSYDVLKDDLTNLKNFLGFDLYVPEEKGKGNHQKTNPVTFIKNNKDRMEFWNYILVGFMAQGYMKKYYKFDTQQKNALYILQTFHKEKFQKLDPLFSSLLNDRLIQFDQVINKSPTPSWLLVFIFELTIVNIVSNESDIELYKTPPFSDRVDKIDAIINHNHLETDPIEFIDFKSSFRKDSNFITEGKTKSLSDDLAVFLRRKFGYDINKIIQDIPAIPIRQINLGAAPQNYSKVSFYLKYLLSSPEEQAHEKNKQRFSQIHSDLMESFLSPVSR